MYSQICIINSEHFHLNELSDLDLIECHALQANQGINRTRHIVAMVFSILQFQIHIKTSTIISATKKILGVKVHFKGTLAIVDSFPSLKGLKVK